MGKRMIKDVKLHHKRRERKSLKNLSDYFKDEQECFLEYANYEIIKESEEQEEYELDCSDKILVDVEKDNGVKVTLERSLYFNPESLFKAKVVFVALLEFREERKDELDWDKINLAQEFLNNGEFVLRGLTSRASILISQITSSCGQMPIITPPSILIRKQKTEKRHP